MVNVMYEKTAFSGNVTIMRPVKKISNPVATELLANQIRVSPLSYLACEVRHTLFFSNVIFVGTFSIYSVMGNENIIIENCTFNKRVTFKNFKNSKLIIRNCTFNEELYIEGVETENLELFNTTHHNDVHINGISTDVYFTSSIKTTNNHLLFLNDAFIKQCIKH
jgi:hypothetical protein